MFLICLSALLWRAPELLREDTTGTSGTVGTLKGDVYSFAVIVHEILFRVEPYESTDLEPQG